MQTFAQGAVFSLQLLKALVPSAVSLRKKTGEKQLLPFFGRGGERVRGREGATFFSPIPTHLLSLYYSRGKS